MRFGICVVTCLAMVSACAGGASASSRAEFDQVVQQLQAKPGDTALRERVIKMALELKPAPAIPEEARASFVEGSTILKSAADAAQQKIAVQSFQEALKIAPWWGDAYYNLALAQELASDFAGAKGSLKFYLLSKPGEKEAREAQDHIYALNAKIKLANAKPARQATPPRGSGEAVAVVQQAADPRKKLEGGLWRGSSVYWRNAANAYEENDGPDKAGVHYVEIAGGQLEYYQDGVIGRVSQCKLALATTPTVSGACGEGSIAFKIADDGQSIVMEQWVQVLYIKTTLQRVR